MAAEATEAQLPFGMGKVDLFSFEAVFVVLSLIGGMTIYHMTDGIGQNVANQLNSTIGSVLGTNPATGEESSGPEGV